MISFRYHLVSLVAAFLALAVGIVIGSTLADRAIVDGLRNRVDNVSANLDDRQAANDRLQEANDRLTSYISDGSARFVADELVDQPVVLVVEQGAQDDAVDATLGLLVESGAQVRARVDVRPEWLLDDGGVRAELATALGIDRADAATMRARVARLMVADLASPVVVADDETGPIDTASALGLIDYDEITDVVLETEQSMAFVIVTGTNAEVGPAMVDLARAMVDDGNPTLVAASFDPAAAEASGEQRGDRLTPILEDQVLVDAIATVDDLDLPQGPLTATLVLADAVNGTIGHFGYGAGADAAMPEPSAP